MSYYVPSTVLGDWGRAMGNKDMVPAAPYSILIMLYYVYYIILYHIKYIIVLTIFL